MRKVKFRYRFKNRETGEIVVAIVPLENVNRGISTFISIIPRLVDPPNVWDWLEWEVVARDEFTGIKDSKGEDVYEGDIDKRLNEIIFDDGCFKVFVDGMGSVPLFLFKDVEIIGNIHENP